VTERPRQKREDVGFWNTYEANEERTQNKTYIKRNDRTFSRKGLTTDTKRPIYMKNTERRRLKEEEQ